MLAAEIELCDSGAREIAAKWQICTAERLLARPAWKMPASHAQAYLFRICQTSAGAHPAAARFGASGRWSWYDGTGLEC